MIDNMVSRIMVGLGSNRGASVDIVRCALQDLESMSRSGFRASSLWRTSPVDCPPGSSDFVNAVAVLVIDSETPEKVLRVLKGIERRYGDDRMPIKNSPRELDLDLLLYSEGEVETVCEYESLTLPHPRATNRRFVMVPAAEVAPDWIWPGTQRRIADLARDLVTNEKIHRV